MKDETLQDLKKFLDEKTIQITSDTTKPKAIRGAALLTNLIGNMLITREQQMNIQNEFDKDFEDVDYTEVK